MKTLFDINGLCFWDEKEIRTRNYMIETFESEIKNILLNENSAWKFHKIEAPLLNPSSLINANYTNEDIFVQENINNETPLVLRPETTPSSYVYAQHLLNSYITMPPFVVWQAGKSFRREQDQVSKNMRLKEFYQQEFQCIYTKDTMNDYQENVLESIRKMLGNAIGLPTRIVESDRLPSYSLRTMDVEVDNGDKWMEVCSISKRIDFPQNAVFQAKGKSIEKELFVLEIAIGLDRCVYNYINRLEK